MSIPLGRVLRPPRWTWHAPLSQLAFLLGLTACLLGTRLQSSLETWRSGRGAELQADTIIVQQEVSLAHTMGLAKVGFDERELADLQQQTFVRDLAPLGHNQFTLSTDVGGPLGFYTELSVESVPARFLSERPGDWAWQPGAPVPVLISADFLAFYNFVFAPSRGLPKLPPAALGLMSLPIVASGNGLQERLTARVVGVTEQLPTLVVPETFTTWANQRYAETTTVNPARVIIRVNWQDQAAVATYLDRHGWTTNKDRLRPAELIDNIDRLVALALAIAAFVVVLSIAIAALGAQVLVHQSRPAIQLLLDLGYRRATVCRWLLLRQARNLVLAGVVAALLSQQIWHQLTARIELLQGAAAGLPATAWLVVGGVSSAALAAHAVVLLKATSQTSATE